MIEVSKLVKYYGERQVLHGLNFSVGMGRVCGFLGPNGSGKSTTMDIIAGLLGPSDGEVRVCGFDVVKDVMKVKEQVGYLPDNPPLHREMKVAEFVDYVGRIRGLKATERSASLKRVLRDCDVEDVQDRLIGNLSKGYRQRVALCSALIHNPKVLVLDEPTEGLDPNQILHIRNLVKKLAQDRTVILSSHILSEVQAVCDDVVVIHQGSIVANMKLDDAQGGKPDYVFSFGTGTEAAVSWFKERNFVNQVSTFQEKPNSLLVNFRSDFWNEEGERNIARVNSLLVQQGLEVTGIQEHKAGLESLYFNVIKSQSQNLAN